MNKCIVILTALPIEANCCGSGRFARIGSTIRLNPLVVIHITVMGAEQARIGARYLAGQKESALVSWGIAGGLDPKIAPGQLIIPDKILSDNAAQVFVPDFILDQHIYTQLSLKLNPVRCSLLQVTDIVTSTASKQELFNQYQAAAIDMESASIADIAREFAIPFIVIRAIADHATLSMPHWFNACLDRQKKIIPWKFIRFLCTYPSTLLSLLHLARSVILARRTLTVTAKLTNMKLV